MSRSRTLVRLFDRRAHAFRRYLPSAIAGSEIGVHQARVASRRLRETVPVLANGVRGTKAGKVRRRIRRLTRTLGVVRELDVTLHLIDELRERPDVPGTALAHVRARVVQERESLRQVMHKRLARVDLEKLYRRLDSLHDALRSPPPECNWQAMLAARLVARARRLDRAIERAGRIYSPEALHGVRVAIKKLRYVVEIANDTKAVPSARALRLLKRAQDTLGRAHDLQVLQDYIARVASDPDSPHASRDPLLALLSRQVEDECRQLHGRYVAMLPALRKVAGVARADTAVRVVAAKGPRTARMSLTSHLTRAVGAVRVAFGAERR